MEMMYDVLVMSARVMKAADMKASAASQGGWWVQGMILMWRS